MTNLGHGEVGQREQPLTHLLPITPNRFTAIELAALAAGMKADPDTVKDGPDPEENLFVPAGYTYFGQFVDHDLTFDSTSSLNPDDKTEVGTRMPTNLRTPRFDLDSLYGDGPDAQPFMYAEDGATLLYGGNTGGEPFQLLRGPNGRAIIGDKRNDENSIVCQIQLGFLKFHNAIVALLKNEPTATWNTPNHLFASAQNEVRWTYQKLVLDDFLPRIVHAEVLADLQGKTPDQRAASYALYDAEKRSNLPREFVGAAYRFGHSGVRTGYRLNPCKRLSIFPGSDEKPGADSLLGFEPLAEDHVIDDWGRFFPTTGPGADINITGRVAAGDSPEVQPNIGVILQYAYKLDPTIVDPLGILPPTVAGDAGPQAAADLAGQKPFPTTESRPSLATLNLLRGNLYGLATGQEVAAKLREKGKPAISLTKEQLVIRTPVEGGDANAPQQFTWQPIPTRFESETPLWFYVLAEAQAPLIGAIHAEPGKSFSEDLMLNGPAARTQLGWVGGRIVAEIFYGLIDADQDSFLVSPAAKNWKPRLDPHATFNVRALLDFAKKAAAPAVTSAVTSQAKPVLVPA